MATSSPEIFHLGAAVVALHAGYTLTRFPDGSEAHARHDDLAHLGQARMAADLGYADEVAMNREHDLLHSLLASWLGLPCSPALQAVARGVDAPMGWIEEATVLALQRFAVSQGVDVVALARQRSA